MISLIQHFEAYFLWKVSLKILYSGILLKTFTHVLSFLEREYKIFDQTYWTLPLCVFA